MFKVGERELVTQKGAENDRDALPWSVTHEGERETLIGEGNDGATRRSDLPQILSWTTLKIPSRARSWGRSSDLIRGRSR